MCRWPFPMYPLTGNHCLLYDCFLSGQRVPSALASWTAQKSYSELHLGREGWYHKICWETKRKMLLLCTTECYGYQLFPQLFCSTEEDNGSRSGDPHIARRCQQGMKYLVFLQGLIGLLPAFSILSRSDKTVWGAKTQEGQIYLSKWLNGPKGFLRT